MSTVFRTVAKCLCLDLNLFLFCRVSDIVQKVTYQERLERRYDVVYWNTTFKLKTLEKNEIFGCLLRKRSSKRTFLWPKNVYLDSIGKKIDLTWTRVIGYSFQTTKTECRTFSSGRRPYVLIIIRKKDLILSCTFT